MCVSAPPRGGEDPSTYPGVQGHVPQCYHSSRAACPRPGLEGACAPPNLSVGTVLLPPRLMGCPQTWLEGLRPLMQLMQPCTPKQGCVWVWVSLHPNPGHMVLCTPKQGCGGVPCTPSLGTWGCAPQSRAVGGSLHPKSGLGEATWSCFCPIWRHDSTRAKGVQQGYRWGGGVTPKQPRAAKRLLLGPRPHAGTSRVRCPSPGVRGWGPGGGAASFQTFQHGRGGRRSLGGPEQTVGGPEPLTWATPRRDSAAKAQRWGNKEVNQGRPPPSSWGHRGGQARWLCAGRDGWGGPRAERVLGGIRRG